MIIIQYMYCHNVFAVIMPQCVRGYYVIHALPYKIHFVPGIQHYITTHKHASLTYSYIRSTHKLQNKNKFTTPTHPNTQHFVARLNHFSRFVPKLKPSVIETRRHAVAILLWPADERILSRRIHVLGGRHLRLALAVRPIVAVLILVH